MLKVERRGKKGIFQIRGSVAGIRVRESAGTDQEPLARAKAADLERRLLEESIFGKERTALFLEAVELYLTKGKSARYLEPLTRHFGTWRMADITDQDVMKFAALHYPGCAPQTINRQVYSPMIAVWNVARRAKLCRAHDFVRPEQPERQAVQPVTDEEIRLILSTASPRLFAAVLMLTFTGGRVSEVCRLRDGDIDHAAGTVLFRKTKSGEPRQVAMPMVLREALLPLRGTEGPLFGFSQRWGLSNALYRACKRAGVRQIGTHTIGRHTFMARLLEQGATLIEGMKAGGWSPSSAGMVARVYGHLEKSHVDERVRAAGTKLTQVLRENGQAAEKKAGKSGE